MRELRQNHYPLSALDNRCLLLNPTEVLAKFHRLFHPKCIRDRLYFAPQLKTKRWCVRLSAVGGRKLNGRSIATVLLGHNHLLLEGLRGVLSKSHFRVVCLGDVLSDEEAHAMQRTTPQLFVIGGLRALRNGADQVTRIKQQFPRARVVVLSNHCGLEDVLPAFRAGADGYLRKDIGCDALIKALDLVVMGECVLPSAIPALLVHLQVSSSQHGELPGEGALEQCLQQEDTLSIREKDILVLLKEGEPNKIIARHFSISEATVKVHIKAILRKIRVRNRTQAAIWAYRNLASLSPLRSSRQLAVKAIGMVRPTEVINPFSV